jgi:hypothetical protein
VFFFALMSRRGRGRVTVFLLALVVVLVTPRQGRRRCLNGCIGMMVAQQICIHGGPDPGYGLNPCDELRRNAQREESPEAHT